MRWISREDGRYVPILSIARTDSLQVTGVKAEKNFSGM